MPIIALVHTLDALTASDIDLSVNLKLLLDGEEERGSPTVGKLIDENGSLLDIWICVTFYCTSKILIWEIEIAELINCGTGLKSGNTELSKRIFGCGF